MKRLTRCLVVAVILLAVGVGGCMWGGSWAYPHAWQETLSESREDHRHRIESSLAHDRRALAEDLDLFFMTDREGRLTRWHDR